MNTTKIFGRDHLKTLTIENANSDIVDHEIVAFEDSLSAAPDKYIRFAVSNADKVRIALALIKSLRFEAPNTIVNEYEELLSGLGDLANYAIDAEDTVKAVVSDWNAKTSKMLDDINL